MMTPPIKDLEVPELFEFLSDLLEQSPADTLLRPDPPPMPPITNGGYRFPLFRHYSHTLQYNEYWYFGFHDNRTGLTGMVAFGVFHPDGPFLGRSLISAALFEPGSSLPYRTMDLYPMDQFTASEDQVEVQIGKENSLTSIRNPDTGVETFELSVRSKDEALSLELQFQSVAPPVLAGDNLPGLLKWEFDYWIFALPGARVRGTATLHGTRHSIEHGGGYHDHSWGIWLLHERIWAWATASDPERGIHVIAGYKCGFSVSTAYVEAGPYRVFFDSRHSTMTWRADPDTWVTPGLFLPPYPTLASMDVTQGPDRLRMTWRVVDSTLLDKSPIALYEQAARIDVLFQHTDPTTGDTEHFEFTELVGHSQFVSRWLRPTPVGESLGED